MNKTLTVNIGGIVFHIEEHAYDVLKKYLESIKGHFTMSDGRDEIMQDIEARIAEMLQERITDSKQVIIEEDVTAVVNVMGKPEQFDDGETKSADEKSSASKASSMANDATAWMGKRRLYRDTDDRVLGGVCAGIGYRLGIDPIWIRLIFFALIWGGGISIWVYILLLIIIPKAETNAQKLEMRGEAVNLSNLAKEFQSESPTTTKAKSTINNIFDTIGEVFVAIFKAFVYFFAAIFGFTGLVLLIALFGLLLAVLGVQGLVHPAHLFDTFISPTQQLWSVVAFILIIGVPVFLIVYRIIKMIFKIKTTHTWLRTGAFILMVLGWVLGFYMIANIARDYGEEASRKNNITLIQPLNDTLFIDVLRDSVYDDINWDDNFGVRIGKKWHINGTKGNNFYMHDNLQFDVEKADGDKFELVQTITSRGRTEEDAYQNASKVNYNFQQNDSLLSLSDIYPLPIGERYHGQSIKLVLKVPVGKKIFLSEKTKHIISDIENVTGTWDWEMTGYTWTMTDKGLECVGCNLTNNNENNSNDRDKNQSTNIKIDKDGVQISTDKDTIVSKNVNIKVDENGVQINTGDSKDKKNK